MKPAALVARVADCGFRIEVDAKGNPTLRRDGGRSVPPDLLEELKEHRLAVVRHLLTTALLARAGERRLWGLTAGEPGIKAPKGRTVPATWDYACAEGDAEWTPLPRIEIG